ncbi:MAG: YceI family protein [Chitinophagaceae bacterium]|nr:YceI family protein [Chitinophagaceae bacterium]
MRLYPFLLTFLFLFQPKGIFVTHLVPVDAGSKVAFTIKNFGIAVNGTLSGIDGKIYFNPGDLASSTFNVTVRTNTIDTDNSMRDASLKKDYFDTEAFPVIRLISSKVSKAPDGSYNFSGKLTIKGITKDVTFPFQAVDRGNSYLFTGGFAINRLDYNVGERSSILSSKVNISLKVSALKK